MVQPRRKDGGLEKKVDPAAGTSSLQRALEPFGFKVSKFEGEHGIDPAVIMEYRERPDGTVVYLCREEVEGKPVFYTLIASKKIGDWKEIIRLYRSE